MLKVCRCVGSLANFEKNIACFTNAKLPFELRLQRKSG